MDLTLWLKTWFARHPLNGPTDGDRARYTAEVMARVKALTPPAPAPGPVRSWLPWPRLALTLATVAAGILLMVSVTRQTDRQLAMEVSQEPRVLAAREDTAGSEERVDETPAAKEALFLAESPPSDDQWLEETLQLLDELDEDALDDTAGNGSDDLWLEELQQLDESELAASS